MGKWTEKEGIVVGFASGGSECRRVQTGDQMGWQNNVFRDSLAKQNLTDGWETTEESRKDLVHRKGR